MRYLVPMLSTRFLLYGATAAAEILGCYLPYLWLRQQKSPLLLVPGAASLALFAWLLTLHPTGPGRTYAAYGGVYIVAAVFWSWAVDGRTPTRWDLVGAAVSVLGAIIIVAGARN